MGEINLKMFDGLSSQAINDLKTLLEPCSISAGETVLHQGDLAVALYIIVNGTVEVFHRPYDGPPLTVAKLGSGGVFGWSSVLGRDRYSSSAIGLTDCRLYRILSRSLQNFCELHHETGMVLLEKIALSVAQKPDEIHSEIITLIQSAMSCRDEEHP